MAEHKRAVTYLSGDYMIICDDFVSRDGNSHEYEMLYHTPIGYYRDRVPDVPVSYKRLNDWMEWSIGTVNAVMKAVSKNVLASDVVEGKNPSYTVLSSPAKKPNDFERLAGVWHNDSNPAIKAYRTKRESLYGALLQIRPA